MISRFRETPARGRRMNPPAMPRAGSRFRGLSLRVLLVLSGMTIIHGPAAIIGTNGTARSLSRERIAELPADRQPAWREYLRRSEQQRMADQDFLRRELQAAGLKAARPAPAGRSSTLTSRRFPSGWYAGEEARRMATIVRSYQTPAGGWSKNMDWTREPRPPGGHFATGNVSGLPTDMDNERPLSGGWSHVGTFDNGATTTELRFLARVIAVAPEKATADWRAAFGRGLDYIFRSQYPNGGWPQVWPLQGGYHDAITFNDGVMLHILELLEQVRSGHGEFSFSSPEQRAKAAAALTRGVSCILAAQIVVEGRHTVWCQQHDALTLEPAPARNYEMPSASAGESAGIMEFLMRPPDPGTEIIAAVRAAAAWFQKTRLMNVAWRTEGERGRLLVAAPGSGPIWARLHDLKTDCPIFGDRDRTIHDTVEGISAERRNGYSWFGNYAGDALKAFAAWQTSIMSRASAAPN